MELIKCSSCGANNLVVKGQFYVCEYCGSKFKRERSNAGGVDVRKALENARNAYRAESYDVCQVYCGSVLSVEPNHPIAIYMRGASSFRSNLSMGAEESRAWKLACSMAEEFYTGTSVPLMFAATCFPMAMAVKLDKKKAVVSRVDEKIIRINADLDKALERENRLDSDIVFRAASEIQDFLDDVSGEERQRSASSKELKDLLKETELERDSAEVSYAKNLSDLLADTWNLICEYDVPISLLKLLKMGNETLEKSLAEVAKLKNKKQFSSIIDSSRDVARQVRDFVNDAIIEVGEKEHPGLLADYHRYLAQIEYDKSQRDARIRSIEAELSNTGLFEVKKQFTLRKELHDLRNTIIGPSDPRDEYVSIVLNRFYQGSS